MSGIFVLRQLVSILDVVILVALVVNFLLDLKGKALLSFQK
ncbi:hypothetical protein [Bartonella sp. CB178]